MFCEHPAHRGSLGYKGHYSCCCHFPRRFISREEELERLKRYRDQLKKELAGVEEKMKEMG
jgi:hypothetical protein